MFGRIKSPRPLGYTVTAQGNTHRCQLPTAKHFGRGATIRCDYCGRTATCEYNGFVGNYWSGSMGENQ